MHVKVYGPFFFMETTITGIAYLDILQQFLIPQLDKDDQEGRIHFQQDGAFPRYLEKLRVPQHPLPRSVDWSSGADSMATSFLESYTPPFFLMGIR
jgi:hypothetical protein